MLAEQIKQSIEKYTINLQQNNLLLVKAQTGQLAQGNVTTYLYNLMYIFQQTTFYLSEAARRSRELGFMNLEKFLLDKIPEELGHDNWARQDLETFGIQAPSVDKSKLLSSTKELVKFVKDLIDEDPRLFLSYMVFVEYFTVLAGPQFLQDLETKCGIKKTSMTAIGNHEEADRHHSQEDFKIIDQVPYDTHFIKTLEHTLEKVFTLVNRTLNQCAVNES